MNKSITDWLQLLSIYLVVLVLSFLFPSTLFFIENNVIDIAQAQTAFSGDSSSFITYTNNDYGIKIQYPGNWIKVENIIVGQPADSGTQNVAIFYSPDCLVGVSIAIEKLANKTTLNQYVNLHTEELKKNQPSMGIIESKNITLAGFPAYRVVASGLVDIGASAARYNIPALLGNITLSPFNATSMDNIVLHNNNAYVVGYTDSSGKSLDQFSNLSRTLYGLPFDACSVFREANLPTDTSGDLGGMLSNGPAGTDSEPISDNLTDGYSRYLPTAQKMFDSFQLTSIGTNDSISVPTGAAPSQCQDLIAKLNARLVAGEINTQQYDEIRQKIGC
ncbi:MAG TPA: PsbP-related protein [Nitrososphaeraceae archaeon]|nr:PsbP-related protein [Nitrososphaeraceae archaeon]